MTEPFRLTVTHQIADLKPWQPTRANWYGVRCVLRLCPCDVGWIGAQHWAYCTLCGWPRVPLNTEAECGLHDLDDGWPGGQR